MIKLTKEEQAEVWGQEVVFSQISQFFIFCKGAFDIVRKQRFQKVRRDQKHCI
jgi:hypothetical protein